MMLLAGCQNSKNEPVPQETENVASHNFRENKTNMYELLHINGSGSSLNSLESSTNSSNAEDLIDLNLYNTAQELKNIVATDLSVRNWIVSRAKSTRQEVVKMKDLINAFPRLQSNFSAFGRKFNFRNYEYEIDFLAINAGKARLKSQTIISPGFELYDDSITGQPDIVFGWLLNATNVFEINIGENDVNNTSIPVIISTLSMTRKTGEDVPEENNIRGKTIHSKGYRINFRYDRSNWSEFTGVGGVFNLLSFEWSKLRNNNHSDWEIASIHRRDVSTNIENTKQFCGGCYPFMASANRLVFNTFERDWYAGEKFLGSSTISGFTQNFRGHMKFDGEWYAYEPNNPLPPIDLVNIFNNSPYTTKYENWKGYIELNAQ